MRLALPTEKMPAAAWMLVALAALAAAGKPILFDTLDPDLFWHLRVAEQLRVDGIGPLVDRISFSSEKTPWTPYSWLAELAMAAVWNTGGYRAAVACTAMLTASFVLMIALTADEAVRAAGRRVGLPVALAAFAAAFLSLAYFSFRPVSIALVLLAAINWLLWRDRRTGATRSVWLIPPLLAICVNVHLFAAIGGLMVMLRWLSQPTRRCTILLGLSFLALLATPMLPGAIATAWHYQTHDTMVAAGGIAEMRPFYTGGFGIISAVVVVAMLASIARRGRALSLVDAAAVLLAVMLILRMGRLAPVFAILVAPIFAASIATLSDRALLRPMIGRAMAFVLAVGLVRIATAFPTSPSLDAFLNRNAPPQDGYPTEAAAFVMREIAPRSGRLINEFTWGGYLGWRLGDRYQVLLDGRTQMYSAAFWKSAYLGDDAGRRDLFRGAAADAAIVSAKSTKFRMALESLGWTRSYHDTIAEVWQPPVAAASAE